MTDRTLRDKIEALRRNPGDWSNPESADEYNGALDDVLGLLDESERPAPAASEPYTCRTCRRRDPAWQLCDHPACPDGR